MDNRLIHRYRTGGSKVSVRGASGTIRTTSGGSGGGTVDAAARATGAQAQAAINAITPNIGDVIQPAPGGARVIGPDGKSYENATAAPITLTGNTLTSLAADGMTEVLNTPTDTGTNFNVLRSAAVDEESPTLLEIGTWYVNNTSGAGAHAVVERTPHDILIFTSPLGKIFTYAAGDGDAGTDPLSLVSIYDPTTSSAVVEVIHVAAATLDSSPTHEVLHIAEATAPLNVVIDGASSYSVVDFPVAPATATSTPMRVARNSASMIRLTNIANDPNGYILNENRQEVLLHPTTAGNWVAMR